MYWRISYIWEMAEAGGLRAVKTPLREAGAIQMNLTAP
jgi:hypothetical protein